MLLPVVVPEREELKLEECLTRASQCGDHLLLPQFTEVTSVQYTGLVLSVCLITDIVAIRLFLNLSFLPGNITLSMLSL